MKYPSYLNTLKIDEKLILLESQHGRDIDGNIYYIARELLTNSDYSRFTICITAANRKVSKRINRRLSDVDTSRLRILMVNSDEYFRTVASAAYLFNDNTFLPFFVKRDEQVYANVWHGTPLKTLGRRDMEKIHAIGNAQKNFFMADYLLYPNEYTRDHMIQDYMIDNLSEAEILLGGYPRNTAFFDEGKRAAIRRKENFGSRTVYVYMPTWRSETFDNQSQLEAVLSQIDERLTTDELFYIKLHPVALEKLKMKRLKNIRLFPEAYETYEFLNAADCLITDYSSVMFDYMITGRRIVLFTYDEAEYISIRGMYMNLSELPYAKARTADELFSAIRCTSDCDYQELSEAMCKYDNPDATRLLCSVVIKKENPDTKDHLVVQSVPNNGKENVIIYSGNFAPNGVTLSLISMLKMLDTSKYNYYLTFTSTQIEPYKDRLLALPEGVRYISCVGRMNATFGEKLAIIRYGHKHMDFDKFLRVTENAYELDYKRLYGNNNFKTSIQYSGYNYKKILSFLHHNGRRIIFVHNDMKKEIETRGNQREEILRYAYPRYDSVIAVSDEVSLRTEDFIDGLDNLQVINNIVDTKGINFKKSLDIAYNSNTQLNTTPERIERIIASDSFKFVNVGRFSPEKGHERLIRAFNEFYKEHNNSYLIIIGGNQWENTYDYLKDKLLPSLECRDNVILILDVSNPFAIVGRCDGFIFSSLYEGFGMVLMEAAVMGLPVASVELEASKQFLLDNGGHVVENSEKGVLDGLKWLASSDAVSMHANFDKYNRNNIGLLEEAIEGSGIIHRIMPGRDNTTQDVTYNLAGIKNLERKNYLAWKISGGNIEFRRTERGADRYYGDIFLGSMEKDFFRIRNLEIRNNTLMIEGSVGFYGVQADENLEVTIVNHEHSLSGNNEYITEIVDRNHPQDDGISMRVVAFRCRIPIEQKSRYRLAVRINVHGIEFEEPTLIFDEYSPIGSEKGDGYRYSYYYREGWSIRTDGRDLIVETCSVDERLRLETLYEEELSRKSIKGRKTANLRRQVIEVEANKTKPILLINDRITEAGDNGEAFFIYVNDKHADEVDSYFVVSKLSEDYDRLRKYGNVVDYGSNKHRDLMLIADAIVSSRPDSNFRKLNGEYTTAMRDFLHKPFILLEHGMSPGKDFHTWLHRSNTMISGFAVASEEEYRQYIDDKYGYTDEELWVTGLPRFDRLYDDSRKLITVMPTWRKELCGDKDRKTGTYKVDEDFMQSTYARFWKSFMENESLNETAKRLGYEIVFRAHPNFRHQEEHFGFDNYVKIGDDDKPYREIFAETALLVTDYSGVSFDFGYLEKPVVYAQFEKEGLARGVHTYRLEDSYDYAEKGFGEVEVTAESAANRVVEYMERDCLIKPKYLQRVNELYKYRDMENCERVYAEVCRCIREHGV